MSKHHPAILSALAASDSPLTAVQLSDGVGCHPSTIRRAMVALVASGDVAVTDTPAGKAFAIPSPAVVDDNPAPTDPAPAPTVVFGHDTDGSVVCYDPTETEAPRVYGTGDTADDALWSFRHATGRTDATPEGVTPDADRDELESFADSLTKAQRIDGGGYAWEATPDHNATIDADDVREEYPGIPKHADTVLAIPVCSYGSHDPIPLIIPGDDGAILAKVGPTYNIPGWDTECLWCEGKGIETEEAYDDRLHSQDGHPHPLWCTRCNGMGMIDGPAHVAQGYVSIDLVEAHEYIREGIANAYIADAFATAAETYGMLPSGGTDICDVANLDTVTHETADEAYSGADTLLEKLPTDPAPFAMAIGHAIDDDNDAERVARSFGHYIAMESMGHGVAWTDDHLPHGISVPMTENPVADRFEPVRADSDAIDALEADIAPLCATSKYPGAWRIVAALIADGDEGIDRDAAFELFDLAAPDLAAHIDDGMDLADAITGTYGVEYIPDIPMSYCNAGDSYNETIVRPEADIVLRDPVSGDEETLEAGRYYLASYGDIVETYHDDGDDDDDPTDPVGSDVESLTSHYDAAPLPTNIGTVTIEYLDACLPDYFQGHPQGDGVEVLAIPLHHTDTPEDILKGVEAEWDAGSGDCGIPNQVTTEHIRYAWIECLNDKGRESLASCANGNPAPSALVADIEPDDDDCGDSVYLYVAVCFEETEPTDPAPTPEPTDPAPTPEPAGFGNRPRRKRAW